jgi:hypothetical protein
MNARTQITLGPDMQRQAQAKAAELGISFAEYVRRLVAEDIGRPKPKADVSSIFDLVTDGPPTDIARDKRTMIGEAFRQEHERTTAGKRQPAAKTKRRPAAGANRR